MLEHGESAQSAPANHRLETRPVATDLKRAHGPDRQDLRYDGSTTTRARRQMNLNGPK